MDRSNPALRVAPVEKFVSLLAEKLFSHSHNCCNRGDPTRRDANPLEMSLLLRVLLSSVCPRICSRLRTRLRPFQLLVGSKVDNGPRAPVADSSSRRPATEAGAQREHARSPNRDSCLSMARDSDWNSSQSLSATSCRESGKRVAVTVTIRQPSSANSCMTMA